MAHIYTLRVMPPRNTRVVTAGGYMGLIDEYIRWRDDTQWVFLHDPGLGFLGNSPVPIGDVRLCTPCSPRDGKESWANGIPLIGHHGRYGFWSRQPTRLERVLRSVRWTYTHQE